MIKNKIRNLCIVLLVSCFVLTGLKSQINNIIVVKVGDTFISSIEIQNDIIMPGLPCPGPWRFFVGAAWGVGWRGGLQQPKMVGALGMATRA